MSAKQINVVGYWSQRTNTRTSYENDSRSITAHRRVVPFFKYMFDGDNFHVS